MNITIGNTSKRINSISHIFTGTTLSCKLKEPCSMQSPVFKVQGLTKGNLYNYCSFEGRYYWVDDIIYKTFNIQEVHCHLDPLATYADAIKGSKVWAKYADSAHWNKDMDDMRFQPEKQATGATAQYESLLGDSNGAYDIDDEGTFVIKIMACGPNQQGMRTYAMDKDAFAGMLTDLQGFMNGYVQQGGQGAAVDVMQFIANIWGALGGSGSWSDNILSCRWIPLPISAYSGSQANYIELGAVPCTGQSAGTCLRVSNGVSLGRYNKSISIPWATDATNQPFLKNNRWTAFQVITPSGYAEIDTTDLKDQQSLGWFSCIDKLSGMWSAKITETNIDTAEILASFSGQIGIDMMGLIGSGSSFASQFTNAAFTAASAGLSAMSTMQVSEGTSHTTSLVTKTNANGETTQKYEESDEPSFRSVGSGISGSFLPTGICVGAPSGSIGGGATDLYLYSNQSYRGKVVLRMLQYKPKDLANYEAYCDRYGYPCNAYLTVSDVSGYICCVGANVQAPTGISQESQSTINSYLNSGMYIE